MNSQILIFEPELTGHHAPYLRHLILALNELDVQPVVATRSDAMEMPEFQIHLANVSSLAKFDTCVIRGSKSLYAMSKDRLNVLSAAIKKYASAHVWVPYADGLTQVMGARNFQFRPLNIPKETELEGLFFRGGFAYPNDGLMKGFQHALTRFLVTRAGWNVLHMLDPLPFEQIVRSRPKLAHRTRLMPDPVEPVPDIDRSEARRRLEIVDEGRLFCCAGRLSIQKGTNLVLDAFQRVPRDNEDRLLLAGPVSPEVRDLLDDRFKSLVKEGRIVILDRHLSVEEIAYALIASNAICVPYPRHIGSASFVIRAAATGRPLVASDFGWIGWAVKKFKLGLTCNVRHVDQLAATMTAAMELDGSTTQNPIAKRFVQYHSPQNFCAHWTARFRERLSLPASQDLLTWDWGSGRRYQLDREMRFIGVSSEWPAPEHRLSAPQRDANCSCFRLAFARHFALRSTRRDCYANVAMQPQDCLVTSLLRGLR